jgi:hypothetical protein
LLLLLCALATIAGASLRRSSRLRGSWPPEADTFYLPPSSALRVASLGHTELVADLIHARANVYFGTQLHAGVPTKWLAQYLDSAIDMDPKFERLYLSGASMLIYNGQRIRPEMVLAAIHILERGYKAFPFNWEFPFQIGFNYLFELPQDAGEDDPRVAGWRQQGVEMLRKAALFEGVPYYVPNLVARMLTRNGADDLAIRHLERAYAVATNPQGARRKSAASSWPCRAGSSRPNWKTICAAFNAMIARALSRGAGGVLAGRRAADDGDGDSSAPAAEPARPPMRLALPPEGALVPNDEHDPLPYYYRPLTGWLYRKRLTMALSLLPAGTARTARARGRSRQWHLDPDAFGRLWLVHRGRSGACQRDRSVGGADVQRAFSRGRSA